MILLPPPPGRLGIGRRPQPAPVPAGVGLERLGSQVASRVLPIPPGQSSGKDLVVQVPPIRKHHSHPLSPKTSPPPPTTYRAHPPPALPSYVTHEVSDDPPHRPPHPHEGSCPLGRCRLRTVCPSPSPRSNPLAPQPERFLPAFEGLNPIPCGPRPRAPVPPGPRRSSSHHARTL